MRLEFNKFKKNNFITNENWSFPAVVILKGNKFKNATISSTNGKITVVSDKKAIINSKIKYYYPLG